MPLGRFRHMYLDFTGISISRVKDQPSRLAGFLYILLVFVLLSFFNTNAEALHFNKCETFSNYSFALPNYYLDGADKAYADCIAETALRCPNSPVGSCEVARQDEIPPHIINGWQAYYFKRKSHGVGERYSKHLYLYYGLKVCQDGTVLDPTTDKCVLPPPPIEEDKNKQQGKPTCPKGNPCDPSSGNKYESATDYNGVGLSFTRSYNSLVPKDGDLGYGWTGNHYKRLTITNPTTLAVHHADGKGEPFTKTNGNWAGDADTDRLLSETGSGYTINLPDGRTEQYNANGQLISESDRNGQVTIYSYNEAGKLSTLTGPYGHTLQFSYDTAGHLSSLIDPNGEVIIYTYDSQNNLASIHYPDGSQRIYHYENATYPHHLTGVTDENGHRYSTFTYDSEGRATFTGHAQTGNDDYQEGFTLEYSNGGGQ